MARRSSYPRPGLGVKHSYLLRLGSAWGDLQTGRSHSLHLSTVWEDRDEARSYFLPERNELDSRVWWAGLRQRPSPARARQTHMTTFMAATTAYKC